MYRVGYKTFLEGRQNGWNKKQLWLILVQYDKLPYLSKTDIFQARLCLWFIFLILDKTTYSDLEFNRHTVWGKKKNQQRISESLYQ